MLTLILKYQLRTGKAQQIMILPCLFIPLAVFIEQYPLVLWMMVSISFVQGHLLKPLKLFPESEAWMSNGKADQGDFLRKMNLLFLTWMHAGFLVISILLHVLNKIDLSGSLFGLSLFNAVLFGCFFLGNKQYIASTSGRKKRRTRSILSIVLMQCFILMISFVYLVIYLVSDGRLLIPVLLTISIIFIWHIHLNKLSQHNPKIFNNDPDY
ncbi:MAG: hypothetical protein JW801_09245 [Bacteroidales bacterium]|nr:hypothetical protein [Bacteroidales bacterium]